jgi:hypothetical protein
MTDVSLEPLVDAMLGYRQTGALRAAVALDLFSEIARVGVRPLPPSPQSLVLFE